MTFTVPKFEPEVIRAQLARDGERLAQEGREPRTTAIRSIQRHGVILRNPQGYADALSTMVEVLDALDGDFQSDLRVITADGEAGLFDFLFEIDDEDVPITAREVRDTFLRVYGLVMPMRVRNVAGIEASFAGEVGR